MLEFKDLNTKLPDGRNPLQEIAKEVLRQRLILYNPERQNDTWEEWVALPVRKGKARKKSARGAEWHIETYRHKYATGAEQEFAIYITVTKNWTIAQVKDGWDGVFVPSVLPIFIMLREMGFDLGL